MTLPAVVQAQIRYPNADGTITVSCYTGPGGVVVIPSTINDLPVTGIGDRAFRDCTNLTNVTIPNSVTSIGQEAFGGCYSLTNVAIPKSVTSIGRDAFYGCTGLTSVLIGNSVTSIADGTFEGTGLKSVTIPESVTSIGRHAFYGCTGLTCVLIGNRVTSIGEGTLEGTSLTNITIPDSVTNIGNYAFSCCTNLASVTIGSGVTSIGREAFRRCANLADMTIPKSVTSIGQDAFGGCVKLARVYFKGDAPSPGAADMFDGDSNATVCYLPGTSGWGPTFGGRPTALWDTQVPYAYTTHNGMITNTEFMGLGLTGQAEDFRKPLPSQIVQSTSAIQHGRVTSTVGEQSASDRILTRKPPVMMALAGGLGVSALLALSVAYNKNGFRAKRRNLAGPKIELRIPRRTYKSARARDAIEGKLVDPPVSRQRKSQLRMVRDKRCRLCGEPAVRGAFCLKHGITRRASARGKLMSKPCNNNTLSNKLDAKAKAPARRKRTKKSK